MTTLRQRIRIRSPLQKVYTLAEDPERWASWYVGISDEEQLTRQECRDSGLPPGSLKVGLRFPLTQRVLEDCFDARGASWRTRSQGSQAPCQEGFGKTLVMLDADQSWTYKPIDSETEVTIELELHAPALAAQHGPLEEKLERLESGCLKQTLENLRQLCEAA